MKCDTILLAEPFCMCPNKLLIKWLAFDRKVILCRKREAIIKCSHFCRASIKIVPSVCTHETTKEQLN